MTIKNQGGYTNIYLEKVMEKLQNPVQCPVHSVSIFFALLAYHLWTLFSLVQPALAHPGPFNQHLSVTTVAVT